MTDEATERQTALPIKSELAEAIGALSADAFEGGIAPSPEAGATVTPESRFAVLVEKTSYLDNAAAEKLKRAYEYASTAHKGVKRKSGEPLYYPSYRGRAHSVRFAHGCRHAVRCPSS